MRGRAGGRGGHTGGTIEDREAIVGNVAHDDLLPHSAAVVPVQAARLEPRACERGGGFMSQQGVRVISQ